MMSEIKAIERINKVVEQINYKEVYIEIKTDKDKYTIDKHKNNPIGFGKQ